jgi:hypothetical protein
MPTFNLLAEVLVTEDNLNETIAKIERRQSSPIGKLPIVRSQLKSRHTKLHSDRIKIEAAKQYLMSTITE